MVVITLIWICNSWKVVVSNWSVTWCFILPVGTGTLWMLIKIRTLVFLKTVMWLNVYGIAGIQISCHQSMRKQEVWRIRKFCTCRTHSLCSRFRLFHETFISASLGIWVKNSYIKEGPLTRDPGTVLRWSLNWLWSQF